ncbi:MAG: metallophosphoesterase, partial [Alphaproteobacteria bacterium]
AKVSSGRLEPAMGEATISGLAIETDDATGLAVAEEPLRLGGTLRPAKPGMWLT